VLNASSLETIRKENWTADAAKCLRNKQNPLYYCNNHVTHMNLYKNKLIACGSGSTKPVYKVFDVDSFNVTGKGNGACASPNPNHRIVGEVTSLGEIVASVYVDSKGSNAQVRGTYVTEKMAVYRRNLQTKEADVREGSDFVRSFYINDTVYVFFLEKADEKQNDVTATIGRYCQTDNGAQSFISSNQWTTYRKARLNCFNQGADGKTNFHFKHLGMLSPLE